MGRNDEFQVGRQPDEWMISSALMRGRITSEEAADLDPQNFGHLTDKSKVKEIKVKRSRKK
jgi:hypothetical protein